MDAYRYGALVEPFYKHRLIDSQVFEALQDFGGVSIRGPKFCGKTWTGRSFANSEVSVMSSEDNAAALEVLRAAPELAMRGESPHLIDEWQEMPELWDMARNAIDASGKERTFILTGSATPRERKPRHSGVGRIEKVLMRPMTLQESGESSGEVSLAGLFEGAEVLAHVRDVGAERLAQCIVRGGWPGTLHVPERRAGRLAASYVETFLEEDMHKVDGKTRDAGKMRRLMHSLARNVEQAATAKTQVRDMTGAVAADPLAMETIDDYLGVLEDAFLLEEIGPWAPNVRSALRINKKPKFHYVDPSIPASLLRVTPQKLLRDSQTFGLLFEALCLRDILVYAQAMDASVYYYRDRTDLEVDVIVEAFDGAWAGIEVKLGHNQADKAARNLLKLRQKIVGAGGTEPAFLAIVEGTSGYAYTREDGVHVVPIMALGA